MQLWVTLFTMTTQGRRGKSNPCQLKPKVLQSRYTRQQKEAYDRTKEHLKKAQPNARAVNRQLIAAGLQVFSLLPKSITRWEQQSQQLINWSQQLSESLRVFSLSRGAHPLGNWSQQLKLKVLSLYWACHSLGTAAAREHWSRWRHSIYKWNEHVQLFTPTVVSICERGPVLSSKSQYIITDLFSFIHILKTYRNRNWVHWVHNIIKLGLI